MSAPLRLEAQQLEPLAQAGPIGRLDEEDGVDEIHAALAGMDPPPSCHSGGAQPLALDVGELAPLGRQAFGGTDLAQPGGQEGHRLGPRERSHPHRRGGDARDREQRREPARRDLGRPAPPEGRGGEDVLAHGHPGAQPVGGAAPGDVGPQSGEIVDGHLAGGQALLLGHPPDDAERSLELGS